MKTTELLGAKVLLPKKPATKGKHAGEERFSKLGKIHNVVFAPFKQGQPSQVVGVMVQKPDIAGMIKQDDAFVTLESLETIEQGLCVKDPENNVDKAAIKRLNLDFDTCILWHGMEARTKSGKTLGYVSGAEFDQVTGVVSAFLVGDGAGSEALVGSFAIKPEWLFGYYNGAMVLSDEAADAQLTGGLAAKAGEGYAAAAAKASEATAKAGKAVAEATEKGAFALGKTLAKAKRAIEDATEPDAEDDSERPAPVAAEDVRLEKLSAEEQVAADKSAANKPTAKSASTLFALGMVGASFLAACVLPGITASAICEAFGWERGADRSWQEAPVYHGIITTVLVISALVVLIPGMSLFGIMMAAQVINGILLPILLIFMVIIAADKHIMGKYANGRIWNALTWFTIITVIILTIVMFILQAMGL